MSRLFLVLTLTIVVLHYCSCDRYPSRNFLIKQLDYVQYLRFYNYLEQPIDVHGRDDVNMKKLENAVTNFQIMARLDIADMNNVTYRTMHMARCGYPDSLPVRDSNRNKRYILNQKKLPNRIISWRLDNVIPDMTRGDTKRRIRDAFHLWSMAGRLRFLETSGTPDIRIMFAYIDGRGKKLGNCYTSQPGLYVSFDSGEKWTAKWAKEGEVNFYQFAVHQLGHMMGLEHSAVKNSAMEPIYRQKESFSIGYDDVLAMDNIYLRD